MKTQNMVVITLAFALAFALAPVTQATVGPQGGPTVDAPVVTIHSTGNVSRGKTGAFVLAALSTAAPAATATGANARFVNFKVGGTAIPGVDYVALVSPAFVASSGFGVISLKALPDPRASFIQQTYSVVVTLEPGVGYTVGEPNSAVILIKP